MFKRAIKNKQKSISDKQTHNVCIYLFTTSLSSLSSWMFCESSWTMLKIISHYIYIYIILYYNILYIINWYKLYHKIHRSLQHQVAAVKLGTTKAWRTVLQNHCEHYEWLLGASRYYIFTHLCIYIYRVYIQYLYNQVHKSTYHGIHITST